VTTYYQASNGMSDLSERSLTLAVPGESNARRAPRIAWPNGSRTRGPGAIKPVNSPTDGSESVDRSRRWVNVVVATLLLFFTLPLMGLIAFLVKVTSPGPVLYRQPRVGLNQRNQPDRRGPGRSGHDRRRRDLGGSVFTILKFRTMKVDDGTAPQVWAQRNDPRITPLGKVLRKTRLDELPQLFNILKGEMNLVGPRPEQPEIFKQLRNEVGSYPERQGVLPGITGWAQVNNSYDTCIDDVERKVDLDLEYIQSRSAWQDLKIMFKTVPVMIFGKGAQ